MCMSVYLWLCMGARVHVCTCMCVSANRKKGALAGSYPVSKNACISMHVHVRVPVSVHGCTCACACV